jgi:hypothetical protein
LYGSSAPSRRDGRAWRVGGIGITLARMAVIRPRRGAVNSRLAQVEARDDGNAVYSDRLDRVARQLHDAAWWEPLLSPMYARCGEPLGRNDERIIEGSRPVVRVSHVHCASRDGGSSHGVSTPPYDVYDAAARAAWTRALRSSGVLCARARNSGYDALDESTYCCGCSGGRTTTRHARTTPAPRRASNGGHRARCAAPSVSFPSGGRSRPGPSGNREAVDSAVVSREQLIVRTMVSERVRRTDRPHEPDGSANAGVREQPRPESTAGTRRVRTVTQRDLATCDAAVETSAKRLLVFAPRRPRRSLTSAASCERSGSRTHQDA